MLCLEEQTLNHWTARELPLCDFFRTSFVFLIKGTSLLTLEYSRMINSALYKISALLVSKYPLDYIELVELSLLPFFTFSFSLFSGKVCPKLCFVIYLVFIPLSHALKTKMFRTTQDGKGLHRPANCLSEILASCRGAWSAFGFVLIFYLVTSI